MTESPSPAGFTLLEVLVALVIVALGLLAAFGQINQTLTVATRLRDKTLAHWVAMNEMTRLRVLENAPALGRRSDEVELAGTNWRYTVKVVKTPVKALRRVDISVVFADRPNAVVTTLTGFLGTPVDAGQLPVPADQADWLPLDPIG